MATRIRPISGPHWFDAWTRDVARDVTAEDLQRLFTRDTREAYRFFTRGLDEDQLARERWLRRQLLRIRQVFIAFTLRLSPARRALYLISLVAALIGVINLYQGWARVAVPLRHTVLPDLISWRRIGLTGRFRCSSASCWSICWCCWRWRTGCHSRGSWRSPARSSWRCFRRALTRPAMPTSAG